MSNLELVNEYIWHRHLDKPHMSSSLSDAFLSALVAELDNDTVTAIVLVGSYARRDATPYSDVDVIRFVREEPERAQQKLYTYRDGRLVGIVTRTLSYYREGFTVPDFSR
jgi:predicted nucleotidyltransferase